MTIASGFFNSSDYDRVYNAHSYSSIFDGLITDGVFEKIGDHFAVIPGEGMQVIVKTGRAWFDHTWIVNDALLPLPLELGDVTLPRYDAVIIEVNHSQNIRKDEIKISKGVPSPSPTWPALVNNNFVKQYPIAYIYVAAGVSYLTSGNIDQRVGKTDCPYVRVPVHDNKITDIFQNWDGAFGEWFTQLHIDMNDEVVADFLDQIEVLHNLGYDVPVNILTNKWGFDVPSLTDTTMAGIFERAFKPKLNTATVIFNTSGTWNKPSNAKDIVVRLFGGGAGGCSDGCGGGGGHMFYGKVDVPSSVTSIPITIGLGGGPNEAGGTTSFGTYASASGGSGKNGGTGGGGGCGDYALLSGYSSKQFRPSADGGNGSYGGGGGASGRACYRVYHNMPISVGGTGGIYGGNGGCSGYALGYDDPSAQTDKPANEHGYGVGGDGGRPFPVDSWQKGPSYVSGKDWLVENSENTLDFMWIYYANDIFVGVGSQYETGSGAGYSLDGLHWTFSELENSMQWSNIAYGAGKFLTVEIAGGSDRRIAYSTDGMSWTDSTVSLNFSLANQCLAYGNGMFVALVGDPGDWISGLSPTVARSTDGINWTTAPLPFDEPGDAIVYGGGKFIATSGANGAYSTNGVDWTELTMSFAHSATQIIYANNMFIIIFVGNTNEYAYSSDGINWTLSELPSAQYWQCIQYGDNKFVIASGNSNAVAYSSDGVNWTESSLPGVNYDYNFAYGNNKFVLVNTDKVFYSEIVDGTNINVPAFTDGQNGYSGENGINTNHLIEAEYKGSGAGGSGGNGGKAVANAPGGSGGGGGGGGYGGLGGTGGTGAHGLSCYILEWAGGTNISIYLPGGSGGGGGGYGSVGGSGGGYSTATYSYYRPAGGGGGGGYGARGGNGGDAKYFNDTESNGTSITMYGEYYCSGGGGGGGGYGPSGSGGAGGTTIANGGTGGVAAGGGGKGLVTDRISHPAGSGGDGICIITYSYTQQRRLIYDCKKWIF